MDDSPGIRDDVDGVIRGLGLNTSTVAISIGVGAMIVAMMAVALRRS